MSKEGVSKIKIQKFIGFEVRVKFKDGTWFQGVLGNINRNHMRVFVAHQTVTHKRGLLIYNDNTRKLNFCDSDVKYISLV